MAKNGRTCDFTNQVFPFGAPDTGTITVQMNRKDAPATVTTYDVTADGLVAATEGWPEGASREKFTRPRKASDEK